MTDREEKLQGRIITILGEACAQAHELMDAQARIVVLEDAIEEIIEYGPQSQEAYYVASRVDQNLGILKARWKKAERQAAYERDIAADPAALLF